jgi:hypothetical protein
MQEVFLSLNFTESSAERMRSGSQAVCPRWTPVLAIGCGIAAGYMLNELFAPNAAIRTWEIPLADLSFMKEGL